MLDDGLDVNGRTVFMDEQIHVEEVRAGEVGQQHTERDGQQQQRLKFFNNGKIEQCTDDYVHDQCFHKQYGIGDQFRNTGRVVKVSKETQNSLHSISQKFLMTERV